jgi:hypothetical protein
MKSISRLSNDKQSMNRRRITVFHREGPSAIAVHRAGARAKAPVWRDIAVGGYASNDRRLPGMLDIQAEACAAIAAEIKLKMMLTGEQQASQNALPDPEAHDYYLRGRYHSARSNLIDL